MKATQKQYIEFLLHNEEHLKEIQRLEVLHWEIVDECMDKHIYDREDQLPELTKEVKKLVESNYYYDSEIDVMGTIGEAWDDLIKWEGAIMSPKDIIHAIENEVERRPKRKRKYSKMWEKLEGLGLV